MGTFPLPRTAIRPTAAEADEHVHASASGRSVLQAMEILERIADRRAQYVGVSLALADRIQVLP